MSALLAAVPLPAALRSQCTHAHHRVSDGAMHIVDVVAVVVQRGGDTPSQLNTWDAHSLSVLDQPAHRIGDDHWPEFHSVAACWPFKHVL